MFGYLMKNRVIFIGSRINDEVSGTIPYATIDHFTVFERLRRHLLRSSVDMWCCCRLPQISWRAF